MPYVIPALVDSKICADGRKELIEWLTKQMSKVIDQAELVPLIKPMALSLQVTSTLLFIVFVDHGLTVYAISK